MRATYLWGRDMGVVWIEDKDEGGASVTNDAERVIADLVQLGVDPDAQPIVYRDSMGRWDRMLTRCGRFVGFAAIGAATRDEAVQLLRAAAMTPLEMIAEWRKGCSVTMEADGVQSRHPERCPACTLGLIDAMERALRALKEPV